MAEKDITQKILLKLHNQFADVSAYLVEDGEIRRQFLIGNEPGLH